jgi:hypothetical protein
LRRSNTLKRLKRQFGGDVFADAAASINKRGFFRIISEVGFTRNEISRVAVLEEQIALNNGSNQGKKYTKREVIIIIIIIIVGIFLGLDTKH